MRRLLAVAAVFGLVVGAAAQERRPMPRPDPSAPVRLLNDPSVQKDLKISEDDLRKVQAAIKEVVEKTLSPEQLKRLRQIDLQQRGFEAFRDPEVEKVLQFTDEQKEKLRTLAQETGQAMRDLFQAGGNREEAQKKLEELRKQTRTKMEELLNEAQKKNWKEMVGELFEPRRPG